MLEIVLSVLKIIGITLLVILAMIIVLLLLVLFWPFSYKVYGDNKEKINGGVVVSWLLHFISVKVYYHDVFNIEARILGIKIYDKVKKDGKEELKEKQDRLKEDKDKEDKDKETLDSEVKDKEIERSGLDTQDKKDSDLLANDETEEKCETDDFEVFEEDNGGFDKKQKSSVNILGKFTSKKKISFFDWLGQLFDKAWDFIDDLPWKIQEFAEKPEAKIDELVDTIFYYDRILSSRGTEKVVAYVKNKVIAILKAIKPYRSDINVYYASTDPEKAAKAFEAYVMTRPIHPKHTNMEVAFDHDEVKFDIKVKGRILLSVVAVHVLLLIFNKKVKKFIKLMKRED